MSKSNPVADCDLKRLIIAVTWECDSLCRTCNIWHIKEHQNYLTLSDYAALAASPMLRSLHAVHFTGGEPTLRGDLSDICIAFQKQHPDLQMSFVTNSVNPSRVAAQVDRIIEAGCRLQVMLSLNGPPAVYDRSRGINGSYRQVMELSSLLATRHVTYGYNFAMFPFNAHCLKHVFNLSRERGASFNVGFPCNHLRLTAGLARELLETIVHPEHVPIIVRNLCEMEDFPQGRELARFVIWFYGSRRICFNCHAIREYLFVDPHGNVFPCDQIEKRLELGNLREANLEVILMSTQCRDLLKALREQSCQRQCMATCFALNEYLRARENNQLLKMLSWARWQVARVPVLRAFKRALLPRHW